MYIGFVGFVPEISEMNIKCPMWLSVGEHDIYTTYYQQQIDALINARSVTGRVFYRKIMHERIDSVDARAIIVE